VWNVNLLAQLGHRLHKQGPAPGHH
jgi:hypothetical protein